MRGCEALLQPDAGPLQRIEMRYQRGDRARRKFLAGGFRKNVGNPRFQRFSDGYFGIAFLAQRCGDGGGRGRDAVPRPRQDRVVGRGQAAAVQPIGEDAAQPLDRLVGRCSARPAGPDPQVVDAVDAGRPDDAAAAGAGIALGIELERAVAAQERRPARCRAATGSALAAAAEEAAFADGRASSAPTKSGLIEIDRPAQLVGLQRELADRLPPSLPPARGSFR